MSLDEVRKFNELTNEIEELKNQNERLTVQLAGCLTAAEGHISEQHLAKEGDYGWSLAYQKVLELRRKYEDVLYREKVDIDIGDAL